jgi:D-glucosaminate-6-phosphate ammonia-lyase
MVDVPAAYITSGAGSALTLATAALMAGEDDDKIQQLPDTTGMKNEILLQRRQRYWYDRCLELAGARLVEYGTDDGTTREDLESAIGPNTVAAHFYMTEQFPDEKILQLEEVIEIAHAKGVAVTVDAAGQVYPLENFGKYVRMGADFQCIAAKYLGSTQSTGLALGSKQMIDALAKQSFVGYESRRIRGVGRPHKVDRQEMMGVVAAVRRWFTMDHESRLAEIEQECQAMLKPLQGLSGVKARMLDNTIGHQPFGVEFTVDKSVTGISTDELADMLREGDPRIWVRTTEHNGPITLHAFGLNPGEAQIVGDTIAHALS